MKQPIVNIKGTRLQIGSLDFYKKLPQLLNEGEEVKNGRGTKWKKINGKIHTMTYPVDTKLSRQANRSNIWDKLGEKIGYINVPKQYVDEVEQLLDIYRTEPYANLKLIDDVIDFYLATF